MDSKTIYLTVRIDLESDNEITDEVIQEVVSEMGYDFASGVGGVVVTDTEICGVNE